MINDLGRGTLAPVGKPVPDRAPVIYLRQLRQSIVDYQIT